MANEKKTVREPSFILALVPIVAMIGFMLYCFRGHSESGYHDAHMPLVLSIVVACIVGAICGHSFKEMLAGMIERLHLSRAQRTFSKLCAIAAAARMRFSAICKACAVSLRAARPAR